MKGVGLAVAAPQGCCCTVVLLMHLDLKEEVLREAIVEHYDVELLFRCCSVVDESRPMEVVRETIVAHCDVEPAAQPQERLISLSP